MLSSPFFYPVCLMLLVFWLSFWVVFYFVRRSLFKPLERRVRRLEKLMGPNTQDFTTGQVQTRPQPPYNPKKRYVTVDREMTW